MSKSNATSFKPGRKKTGGRKAGTPNKTTASFKEAMLAAAHAAGDEVGEDGLVGYLKRVALNHPTSFVSLLAALDAAAARTALSARGKVNDKHNGRVS